MAYADEIAAANRLTTREERFAARNAVRAKYGMEAEKKTRGGVAGIYDRNKKVIGTGATALGYLFGGPAGAAVVRGTMQGLDRPGEGGIGFDVGRAARGAAEGYSAASVADIGKAGVTKLGEMFGKGTAVPAPVAPVTQVPAQTMPSGGGVPLSTLESQREQAQILDFARSKQPGGPLGKMLAPSGASTGGVAAAAPAPITRVPMSAQAALPPVPPPPSLLRRTLSAGADITSGAFNALKKPEVLAPAAGAVADVFGSMQDRATKEAQVRLEEQQMRMENERRARLAELLMPLFQQQVTQYAGRR